MGSTIRTVAALRICREITSPTAPSLSWLTVGFRVAAQTQALSRYREEAVLPKRVAICQRRYLPCTAINTLLPLRFISSSVGREP